jgi:lipopolysaccharide transport system ATP-binding protein
MCKVDEIVAFADVDKFLDTPVQRYSSGMYVRLAFAVAAHLEPEILIVDEVLAVGDAEFQKKCIGKMHEVASGGRTVLFVSHNMAAISSLTDRSLLLESGQVKFSGNTDACIRHYLQPSELGSNMGAKYHYLQFAEIYERNEKLNPIDCITMGGDIVFKTQFRTPVPTSSPRVGFVLRQQITGEPIFGINTEMAGCAELTALATHFEVSMIIEKLNVVHGDYVIDIYLGEKYQEDYEVALGALRLRIIEADVFGTGRLPYKETGPMYFVPQFTMRILNGGLDGTA